jgi:hypothetical protein
LKGDVGKMRILLKLSGMNHPAPTTVSDHMISFFFGNPTFGHCENHGKEFKISSGFFYNSANIEFETLEML